MAIKLKLGNKGKLPAATRSGIACCAALLIAASWPSVGPSSSATCISSTRRSWMTGWLPGPIFANVAQIYAAPREVRVGQRLSVAFIAQDLRRAGYNATRS